MTKKVAATKKKPVVRKVGIHITDTEIEKVTHFWTVKEACSLHAASSWELAVKELGKTFRRVHDLQPTVERVVFTFYED